MHTHTRMHAHTCVGKGKEINHKMRFVYVMRVRVHRCPIRVYLILVSINIATRISLFIGNKKSTLIKKRCLVVALESY